MAQSENQKNGIEEGFPRLDARPRVVSHAIFHLYEFFPLSDSIRGRVVSTNSNHQELYPVETKRERERDRQTDRQTDRRREGL